MDEDLLFNHECIRFTPAEANLLRYLLANRDHRVTRREMCRSFSTPRERELERNLVNVTINRVRKKVLGLETYGVSVDFEIQSVHGTQTYRLRTRCDPWETIYELRQEVARLKAELRV